MLNPRARTATKPAPRRVFFFLAGDKIMKMGKNDPRASMGKSTKGKSPINTGGRNPIKSAGPYETPGIGETCSPAGKKAAPAVDPVADESRDTEA
jgi:hypothetical protein